MKTYGQFCPVAQALEILAERWTLLVVRELLCGSRRFSELQRGVPLMSRTLLSQRLKTLQDCGIVARVEGPAGPEYHLLEAGKALNPLVEGIGNWGKRFVQRPVSDEELDPSLLMWDLQRRLNWDTIPETRTVVLFRFSDARRGQRRYWLHLEKGSVDVCHTNPGFEVNLTVDTDVRTLTEIWVGQRTIKNALRDGSLVVQGPAPLRKAFPGWLALSTFAEAS